MRARTLLVTLLAVAPVAAADANPRRAFPRRFL